MTQKAQYVKRAVNEKFHEDCIIQTIKHPSKVMFWSVISGKGLGRLFIVDGILKQDQYKKVIETCLFPRLKEWFPNKQKKIFLQDEAPCYTAKSIKNLLSSQKIPLLDWPGNSPDLNPIENVWELLKRKISTEKVKNRTQLIEKVIWHWNHNPHLKEMALNCLYSMSNRLRAVIKDKGGSTKY